MKPIYREHDMDWTKGKECQDTPELFFPQYDDNGEDYWVDEAQAISICNRCSDKPRCQDYAVFGREPDGIWGATTLEERTRIRAKNSRTLPFFIRDIESVIDSVVSDYMFAQDVLDAKSKMQVVQNLYR